jgi:hypothetical protein
VRSNLPFAMTETSELKNTKLYKKNLKLRPERPFPDLRIHPRMQKRQMQHRPIRPMNLQALFMTCSAMLFGASA